MLKKLLVAVSSLVLSTAGFTNHFPALVGKWQPLADTTNDKHSHDIPMFELTDDQYITMETKKVSIRCRFTYDGHRRVFACSDFKVLSFRKRDFNPRHVSTFIGISQGGLNFSVSEVDAGNFHVEWTYGNGRGNGTFVQRNNN